MRFTLKSNSTAFESILFGACCWKKERKQSTSVFWRENLKLLQPVRLRHFVFWKARDESFKLAAQHQLLVQILRRIIPSDFCFVHSLTAPPAMPRHAPPCPAAPFRLVGFPQWTLPRCFSDTVSQSLATFWRVLTCEKFCPRRATQALFNRYLHCCSVTRILALGKKTNETLK